MPLTLLTAEDKMINKTDVFPVLTFHYFTKHFMTPNIQMYINHVCYVNSLQEKVVLSISNRISCVGTIVIEKFACCLVKSKS